MLIVENLRKSFGSNIVLDIENFRARRNEVVCVCGGSGAGKSTLAKVVSGLIGYDSGAVKVNGKVGLVLQDFGLWENFDALNNVVLPLTQVLKMDKEEALLKAHKHLDSVGMLAHKHKYPSNLSGGQKQRVAIARTLATNPDLLILDEPTANLDPKISENIINRLLKPNYNKTVIVITHDFELAKKFDRIIGMKEGKIICDSPPQAFAWELFEKHNSDKRSLPQIG